MCSRSGSKGRQLEKDCFGSDSQLRRLRIRMRCLHQGALCLCWHCAKGFALTCPWQTSQVDTSSCSKAPFWVQEHLQLPRRVLPAEQNLWKVCLRPEIKCKDHSGSLVPERGNPSGSVPWYTTTLAPRLASTFAIPRPIPFPAPVTIAVFPSSLK